MYLWIWTNAGRAEVWGSRSLAETFVLRDHKAAHEVAQGLEAAGLADLEPPDADQPLHGYIYRLAERPESPTILNQSSVSSTQRTHRKKRKNNRNTFVGDVGGSGFKLTEPRFAHGGVLGRGPLWLLWVLEDRGLLGEAVRVGDLASWTGASTKTVSNWLRRLADHGSAVHNPDRSWTITAAKTASKEEWDASNNLYYDYVRSEEERMEAVELLFRQIDYGTSLEDLQSKHQRERRDFVEFLADQEPFPSHRHEGRRFRVVGPESECMLCTSELAPDVEDDTWVKVIS